MCKVAASASARATKTIADKYQMSNAAADLLPVCPRRRDQRPPKGGSENGDPEKVTLKLLNGEF